MHMDILQDIRLPSPEGRASCSSMYETKSREDQENGHEYYFRGNHFFGAV